MRLPSWLTGARVAVRPDPSTHFELPGEELMDRPERVRCGLLLVAVPGVEVMEVDGAWPLIAGCEREPRTGALRVVTRGSDGWAVNYYIDPQDVITVAPAHSR